MVEQPQLLPQSEVLKEIKGQFPENRGTQEVPGSIVRF